MFSFLVGLIVHAQEYEVLTVTSGFNEDVIANGETAADESTTTGVDGANWAYMSTDYVSPSGATAPTTALPADGAVTSSLITGLNYQLEDYDSNNSLKIETLNGSGTLTFSNQVNAVNLYFLVTSGSGSSTVSAEVHFTDGTSQEETGLSVSDWYWGANAELQGLGRVSRNDNNIETSSTNPRIYQLSLAIDSENQSKLVESVEFTRTSSSGNFNVFAASAEVLAECPSPDSISSTYIGTDEATLEWSEPATLPESYDYYYATVATIPTSDITASGNTTETSTDITGLTAGITYYFWVRSVCTNDSGVWYGPYEFETPMCNPEDQCTYTIMMQDSYGDGWNGNTMNFVQNGVTVDSATLSSGTSGNQTITLCNGIPFSIYWSGGSFENEVSFNLISNYTGEQVFSIPTSSGNLEDTTIYTGYAICSMVSCPQPTDLTADEITAYTAELSWTEVGSADEWEVYVVEPGANYPTDDTVGVTTEDNDPYLVEDLDADTDYTYYVRAICGDDDVSYWSGPYDFTTEVSCPQPINIEITALTYESAVVTWEAGGDENEWEIGIVENGAGAPTTWETVTDDPTYTFEALDGLTDYTISIRAICSDDDNSFYTTSNFTTPISNDECNNPIEVPVNDTEECIDVTAITFEGATVSDQDDDCADNNSGDIWYSFVALGTVHEIELVNPTPLATSTVFDDVVISLYDGTCDNLTLLQCTSVNNILVTDLEPGATYLIRITDNSTASNDIGFDLCINTPELPDNQDSFECAIITINSDFELPVVSGIYPPVLDENMIQGWRTTATDGQIEVWPDPNFEDVPAYSGNQFIELNANLIGGVFQDYETPAATTFTYSFAHRARRPNGNDVCELLTGPPGGPYESIGTFSADNSAWVVNTGTYSTPVDQPVTRFIFQAVSTVTGDNSVGNFLDSVSFIADNSIQTENPLAIDCDDLEVPIQAAGGGEWLAVDGNPSETTITDPTSNTTTITGFDLPGTYYYTWEGTYCTSTLEIVYDVYVVEFNYDTNAICYDGENLMPTLAEGFTMGGTFTSTTGLVIDESTGEISTSESTPGTYTVTYTVDTEGVETSCDTEYSTQVTIYPPVMVDIMGDCEGVGYMLTAEPTNTTDLTDVTFEWSGPNGFSGNTQAVQAIYEGTYTVVVTSANGCEYETSLEVESTYCAIPQGISPQGDQYNQSFDLTGLNVDKLEIFNRLGTKVYSQNEYTNQWSGQTDDGELLPVGTYFYVLYFGDEKETMTGWVYVNY